MNWNEVLIRCSSLGNLMTEPKEKAAKDAGELSKTAKSHLKKVYAKMKYGREQDIVTKQMQKGVEVEEESITLLSRVLKKMLYKNDQRLNNEYITGMPDIYEGESIYNAEEITDIKSSYDLFTFLPNIGEPLDRDYYHQLQGYMALSGAKRACIAYCLVDTPDHIINGEKFKLFRAMNVISEESPEYLAECEKIEKNMRFGDIPKEERILLFPIERDEDVIAKIYDKVLKARIFLAEFEQAHLNFNNKS
jgi:hypothetical protein